MFLNHLPLNTGAPEITFIMTVVRENTQLTEGIKFLYKENEFLNAEVGSDRGNDYCLMHPESEFQ